MSLTHAKRGRIEDGECYECSNDAEPGKKRCAKCLESCANRYFLRTGKKRDRPYSEHGKIRSEVIVEYLDASERRIRDGGRCKVCESPLLPSHDCPGLFTAADIVQQRREGVRGTMPTWRR